MSQWLRSSAVCLLSLCGATRDHVRARACLDLGLQRFRLIPGFSHRQGPCRGPERDQWRIGTLGTIGRPPPPLPSQPPPRQGEPQLPRPSKPPQRLAQVPPPLRRSKPQGWCLFRRHPLRGEPCPGVPGQTRPVPGQSGPASSWVLLDREATSRSSALRMRVAARREASGALHRPSGRAVSPATSWTRGAGPSDCATSGPTASGSSQPRAAPPSTGSRRSCRTRSPQPPALNKELSRASACVSPLP